MAPGWYIGVNQMQKKIHRQTEHAHNKRHYSSTIFLLAFFLLLISIDALVH